MMADVADEHYYATGFRQEDIFFGTIAFSSKATSGFGTLIGGVGLDVIAWPRGKAIQSAAAVAPETIVNLGILYGPMVAAFSIMSVWCDTHCGISRERHAEILREPMPGGRRRETPRTDTPQRPFTVGRWRPFPVRRDSCRAPGPRGGRPARLPERRTVRVRPARDAL